MYLRINPYNIKKIFFRLTSVVRYVSVPSLCAEMRLSKVCANYKLRLIRNAIPVEIQSIMALCALRMCPLNIRTVTISLTSQIMTFSQMTLFLFTNLDSNQTPREVEVVDVADMVEEVHMVGVEEEEISKLTANSSLKAKVGKLKHLLLSLLLPKRKILLHFLTLVRHNHLNILQTSQIILKFSKVSYVIIRNS